MKIIKLTPQGYCGGVKKALKTAYALCEDKSIPRPIYMLGSIIHNAFVVAELQKKGIVLLESFTKTKLELLDEISGGTIIFSAHGVAPEVYAKALNKGLNIVDTTCSYVKIIHQKIKEQLREHVTCCYIGTKGHPECDAVLKIDPSILLISNLSDIEKIQSSSSIYVTNQTTLSMLDTKNLYQAIKDRFPNALLDNQICTATTIRQKAVYEQEPTDLCLIVGDRHSSNSLKLVQIGQSKNIPTQLVENVEDVKKIDFSSIQTVSISSGASTPDQLVDNIIDYLKKQK